MVMIRYWGCRQCNALNPAEDGWGPPACPDCGSYDAVEDRDEYDEMSQVKLPREYISKTVRDLLPGEFGYVGTWALQVDGNALLWIDKSATVYRDTDNDKYPILVEVTETGVEISASEPGLVVTQMVMTKPSLIKGLMLPVVGMEYREC